MAQPFITRSVQLTEDEWKLVEDFKHDHRLKSWSKAFRAMLAEWQAYQGQRRKGQAK